MGTQFGGGNFCKATISSAAINLETFERLAEGLGLEEAKKRKKRNTAEKRAASLKYQSHSSSIIELPNKRGRRKRTRERTTQKGKTIHTKEEDQG